MADGRRWVRERWRECAEREQWRVDGLRVVRALREHGTLGFPVLTVEFVHWVVAFQPTVVAVDGHLERAVGSEFTPRI